MLLVDDLNQLLDILPNFIGNPLRRHSRRGQLLEIVLDIGRQPEARFSTGIEYVSYRIIFWQDIDYILKRLGKFSEDNRAGIEKTLHRISSLRNRQGNVIGLTCRIGRATFGTVSIIRDLMERKKSILLLGKPGVGKTTAIREIARILSDSMKKRVIIIDTSNEIAGDGDLPHPSIGKARRMQVSRTQNQHLVMIEAVENHMPEIIIIDEIGTELEAQAARTIAERGVQLVGTAHGTGLENLIKNPIITDLIGGIQYVTLGDEEAKRRGSTKSILERKALPTFDIAVEMHTPKTWIIHENLTYSVDRFLQNTPLALQKRSLEGNTNNFIACTLLYNKQEVTTIKKSTSCNFEFFKKNSLLENQAEPRVKTFKVVKTYKKFKEQLKQEFTFIYLYGINNEDVKAVIKTLRLPIIITKEIKDANLILTLSNLVKKNRKLRQMAHSKRIPLHTIPSNNLSQMAKTLRFLLRKQTTTRIRTRSKAFTIEKIINKEILTPLEETRLAIEEIVIPNNEKIDLIPRTGGIRKKQYALISHYQLMCYSVGQDHERRLRIYPSRSA